MEMRLAKLRDLEPLIAMAASDGHSVVRPTHVAALDNGELIGYASVGAVPMVVFFMHSKRSRPVNTFKMEKYCERLVREAGSPLVCAPCAPESPLWRFMPKLGFTSYGRMDMFIKQL